MARTVLTEHFAEALNSATTAVVDIHAGDGNLAIDRLAGGEPVLASGTLQYMEKQGTPARSVSTSNGQVTLALRAGGGRQRWFRLPWAACNGATEWQIHLNPTVSMEISAHSDGGNVKLDLAGMAVTRVAADTGGGNMDVVLPEDAADMNVAAKTGAGNVTVEIGNGTRGSNAVDASSGAGNVVVHIPSGLAACVHVTSGLGKVIADPHLVQIDDHTYQSPGYDGAADRVEIVAKSGAGDVRIHTR